MPTNIPSFVGAGREHQFGRLQAAFADSLQGQPQIILLAGRAGTGKTTLMQEFCRQAQANNKNLVVAYGQCTSYLGTGDSYLPFKEILALLTGDVQDGATARVINRENSQRLKQLTGHAAEALVELGPDLVGTFIPGAGLLMRATAFLAKKVGWLKSLEKLVQNPPKHDEFKPEQFFEQIYRVLVHLTSDAPLVLVLDDLQWADNGTLDLFFHLTRRLQGTERAPLLLIGSYRPGEVSSGRGGHRHPLEKIVNEINRYWPNASINLNMTIGGEGGRAFTNALVDTEPNRLDMVFREQLFNHTEGHPLFAVEILRLLQDRGILTKDSEGRWFVLRPVVFNELPGRVEAVIRERIARLEDEVKDILTCGSVEGERFTAEVVSRVRRIEELHLAEILSEELDKHHHLIEEESEVQPTRKKLHIYHFIHTLFHQYVYNNLSAMQRQLLHKAVGEALESLYGDNAESIALQLAQHFTEASEEDKALKYSLMAGNQARAAFSNEDSIRHYLRARDIIIQSNINREEERYQLAYSLAQIYALQGKKVELQAEIDEVIRLARESSDRTKLADAFILQTKFFTQASDYLRAQESGINALSVADEIGDEAKIANAHLVTGESCAYLAEHDMALNHFQHALAVYRKHGNKNQEAEAIRHIALVYLNRNDYPEALGHAQEALTLFLQIGDRLGENETLRYIGDIHCGLGDYQKALEDYQRVLQLRREIGYRAREGGALGDIGDIYLFLGFYEESLTLHEQSLDINIEVDYKYGQTWCHHDMGVIHYNLENLQAARDELEKALSLAEEIQAQNLIILSKNDLSLVFRELDDPESLATALRLAHEASETARLTSLIFGQIAGESNQAMAFLRLGDIPKALKHSRTAITMLENHGGVEINEDEILFNHSRTLRAIGDVGAAQNYWKKAYDGVMRKANKINDPAMRNSFLTNVRINREIVEV